MYEQTIWSLTEQELDRKKCNHIWKNPITLVGGTISMGNQQGTNKTSLVLVLNPTLTYLDLT